MKFTNIVGKIFINFYIISTRLILLLLKLQYYFYKNQVHIYICIYIYLLFKKTQQIDPKYFVEKSIFYHKPNIQIFMKILLRQYYHHINTFSREWMRGNEMLTTIPIKGFTCSEKNH